MQKSRFPTMQKLKNTLKNKIKGNVSDIFVIGSFLKDKITPNDVDIIVLFKEKKLKEIHEDLYEIKESLDFIKNIHIEHLFVDSMFEEKIFLTILHEGFSIKKEKYFGEIIKLKSLSIFSFSLSNLNKINKVKFAQSLYGRNKDGLLYSGGGIPLGQGSFMVPVEKEEIFKEMMKKWKVNYKRKRAFVND